jgi:peptide/nickel transport system substrate-binding protein
MIWKPIVSDSTATSDLLAGGTDIDTDMSGTQLGRMRGNHAITLYRIPEQGETFLGFNQAHAPFNLPSVRKAVAEAIDRRSVIKAAATGLAVPAYSSIPSTLPFYDRTAATYAPVYDPGAARRLIAASHATGPYTLLTFNFPEEMTAAELIQAELAEAGVQIKVSTLPLADYLTAAGKGQFDLNILSWGWPDPDFLYQLFDSAEETAGGLNFTFAHDSILDSLIAQGRTTTSAQGAAHVYAHLQRYMDSQVIVDPLLTDDQIYAVRSTIHGWHTNSAAQPLYQDLYLVH